MYSVLQAMNGIYSIVNPEIHVLLSIETCHQVLAHMYWYTVQKDPK